MYYNKYLKYKSKYLNLLEMNGGGYKTALTKFISSINKDTDSITQLLLNDQVLLNSTIKDLLQNIVLNAETIFDYIFKFVNKSDTKNPDIDWIIISYLNNTFGIPSSLENIGRYISARKTINYLQSKIKGLNKKIEENFEHVKDTELYTKYSKLSSKLKNICDFNSLVSLEEYLSEANIHELIDLFEKEDGVYVSKVALFKKIKEEGEKDYKLVLTTDNIIIYQPTSTAGSKYYGRETKWCTASDENNMFDKYITKGPLYIIQSKTSNRTKFQFQYKTKQLMDNNDTSISVPDVIQRCNNDTKLLDWFKSFNFNNDIDSLITFNLNDDKSFFHILKITSDLQFSMSYEINDSVYKKFKLYINKLNSKNKIMFLQLTISFWNIPLDSINQLFNLKTLHLKFYNLSLKDSLDNLTKLQELTLSNYNTLLNNSLDNLTKLQELTLSKYNILTLNNSLDNLTSLTLLDLTSYNLPLNNSLDNLINLEKLELNSYNLQLNNSLDNLTSLIILVLSSYNLQLNKYLDNLTSLILLNLSSYNLLLENSLDKLTNLQQLNLSSYNLPLENSLDKLTNLLQLDLSSYNLPLENSLDKLTNLLQLNLSSYTFPLCNLRKKLTSLKKIITPL